MLLNVGLESLFGLIPFGGAVFDMVYKANDRNVRLIERDLTDRAATRRSSLGVIVGGRRDDLRRAGDDAAVFVASVAFFVWVLTRVF